MTTIPGATSQTYTMTAADVGQNITCTVIGTNSAGSANGTSNSLGPVTAAVGGTAPVNTALPVITGAVVVGSLLSATDGAWTGSPAPSYTYQWQRGVPDVAPVNTVPPASVGSLSVGSTLTLSDGTWTGTAPITYTRQWKRDGVNISGATASTYVLVSGDLGTMISATVTATNAAGNASANAAAVGPVTAAPGATFDPANTAPDCALSGGNLIVTQTAVGGFNATRSTSSYSSGKKFCKFTMNVFNGGNSLVGIGNASASLTNFTGAAPNGIGYSAAGNVWMNSTDIGPLPTSGTPGDVILMAVDFGSSPLKIWFKLNAGNWNNNGSADPATGVGSLTTTGVAAGPYFAMACNNANTAQITADFSGTGAPSGFGAW